MANIEEAKRLYDKGLNDYRAGEYEEALDAFGRAREIYAAAGDRKSESDVLNDAGVVCVQMEEWDQAQHFLDEALTIRMAIGDKSGQGVSLGNIGMMYARQDEDEKAAEAYVKAIGIFRELGEQGNEKAVMRQLSKLKIKKGQYLEALGDYQAGLDDEAGGGPQKLARRLFQMLGRLTGSPGVEEDDEPEDEKES